MTCGCMTCAYAHEFIAQAECGRRALLRQMFSEDCVAEVKRIFDEHTAHARAHLEQHNATAPSKRPTEPALPAVEEEP